MKKISEIIDFLLSSIDICKAMNTISEISDCLLLSVRFDLLMRHHSDDTDIKDDNGHSNRQ
jgi:hypothetical protein